MKYVDESFKNKISLDFGYGPGRNIVKYNQLFKRINGCDIAPENIENCKKNLKLNNVPIPNLYITKGDDLSNFSENFYDFIFSAITLQHILYIK
jgi:ubiquinone/menaquinone biosynthesis C-methylase UbiE|tara:strand:- start:10041 stop:10322 length:282 start_codon:yes stop_codon:yes gene_type:complete